MKNTILIALLAVIMVMGGIIYLMRADNENLSSKRAVYEREIQTLQSQIDSIKKITVALEVLNANLETSSKKWQYQIIKTRVEYENLIRNIADLNARQSVDIFTDYTD